MELFPPFPPPPLIPQCESPTASKLPHQDLRCPVRCRSNLALQVPRACCRIASLQPAASLRLVSRKSGWKDCVKVGVQVQVYMPPCTIRMPTFSLPPYAPHRRSPPCFPSLLLLPEAPLLLSCSSITHLPVKTIVHSKR